MEETYRIRRMEKDLIRLLTPASWPNVHFMENPQPQKKLCCLKRYRERGGAPDTGMIFYAAGIWEFDAENGTPLETGGKELVERLIQEGWIID